MPIYKRCSRCGMRIPEGTQCPCLDDIKHRRDAEYDRMRRDKRSTDFYNSQAWISERNHILSIDGGIDIYLYMTDGEVRPADTVHHIIPLRDDWSLRLQDDNLISLSSSTHGIIEDMYKRDKRKTIKILQDIVKIYRVTQGAV